MTKSQNTSSRPGHRPGHRSGSKPKANSTLNPKLDALDAETPAELRDIFERSHPADIADQLEQLTIGQREGIVETAPEVLTGDVLSELEDDILEDVLPLMSNAQILDAVGTMDSDDITAIVEELDQTRQSEIIAALPDKEREAITEALAFAEETAGRLMQREFVSAPGFWTVGRTIDHMREQYENLPDLFFNIYIVNARFKPIGYVPVSKLMGASRSITLKSLMVDIITTIGQDVDQEDVAYQFEQYRLISAPVVNADGRIVGIVTVDDVVNVIAEENREDVLAMAGVKDAGLADTALSTVRARAPWLLVNLFTAIIASIVIAQFGFAIEEIVALAVLMPIVASMGGNAGTQGLAVTLLGLSERDLTSNTMWRAIRREVLAGLLNGIIFAVILAIITLVWFKNPVLSGVIFAAMVINHVFASMAGIMVPLTLKRFGADPAVASSVFVTTVTDVIGFLAFLGLASVALL